MKIFKSSVLLLILVLLGFLTAASNSSNSKARVRSPRTATPTPTPTASEPRFDSYRGVSIGMSAEVVRTKLGVPKETSASGEFYLVSESESIQIVYSRDRTVRSITVNFNGDLRSAPSTKEILGIDIKRGSDGSINKFVSFPKEGFWLSYVRTGGKDDAIVITIQKLS